MDTVSDDNTTNLHRLALERGISPSTLYSRRHRGMSAERIVTEGRLPRVRTPRRTQPVVIDGVEYPSKTQAAQAHGVSRGALQQRLLANWDLVAAIKTPPGQPNPHPQPAQRTPHAGEIIVVAGKAFDGLKDACRHFKADYTTVRKRLRAGASLEAALGLV